MNFFSHGRLRSFSLLGSDITALAFSIWGMFYCGKLCGANYDMLIVLETWPILLMMIAMNISGRLYCGNLFYPGLTINPIEELRRLTLSCVGSFLIFMAFLSLTDRDMHSLRIGLVLSMLLSLLILPVNRIVLRYLLWRFNLAKIPTLIAGDAQLAKEVAQRMAVDDDRVCDNRHPLDWLLGVRPDRQQGAAVQPGNERGTPDGAYAQRRIPGGDQKDA